jgi:predicted kinase
MLPSPRTHGEHFHLALMEFDWVRAMMASTQDPIHHAEGDVWTHTLMVIRELLGDPVYQASDVKTQDILYLAALLHDVAKPYTRSEYLGLDGEVRVSNHGHSIKGAIDARVLMYENGYPVDIREAVCGLITYHQVPYWAFKDGASSKRILRIAEKIKCKDLAVLARADIRGRVSPDQKEVLENIELFEIMADDLGVLETTFPFATPHSRYAYFRSGSTYARDVEVFDNTSPEVIVMCGLPGSGKDTWINDNLHGMEVVSLDDIREVMGVEHGDRSGRGVVIQAAKEKAKTYLRAKQPFVWNATNLGWDTRRKVLDLLADYNARIKICYVEVPYARVFTQNRNRKNSIPESALRGMMKKWQVPDSFEAHEIVWHVSGM